MTKIGNFNPEKWSKTVNQCSYFCCVLAKIFSTQHTTQKTLKTRVYTHMCSKNRNPVEKVLVEKELACKPVDCKRRLSSFLAFWK